MTKVDVLNFLLTTSVVSSGGVENLGRKFAMLTQRATATVIASESEAISAGFEIALSFFLAMTKVDVLNFLLTSSGVENVGEESFEMLTQRLTEKKNNEV